MRTGTLRDPVLWIALLLLVGAALLFLGFHHAGQHCVEQVRVHHEAGRKNQVTSGGYVVSTWEPDHYEDECVSWSF